MKKSKTLSFSKPLFEKVTNHCAKGFPSEVVGILAGVREEGSVLKVVPLINERADTQNRYNVVLAHSRAYWDTLDFCGTVSMWPRALEKTMLRATKNAYSIVLGSI